ncbi:hypothetical protein GCM10009777_05910 [Microbacterium pumilum]|uniref:Uncharacterized protein n=1 Tax=Microbacterium pumilum TaxID=344165 RepID=A0ABN2RVT7_9MICO
MRITVAAHTEMSRPICTGSTPKSAAISGIKPAGSDSAVTVTNTPNARIASEPRGMRVGLVPTGTEAVEIVIDRG